MRSEDNLISWSARVRDELIRLFSKSEKCRKAELTAILLLAPDSVHKDENTGRYIYEEQPVSAKNSFTERRKTYNIKNDLGLLRDPKEAYRDFESKRAFLRGAFIASGSFTDPNKSYQFEISTDERWQAEELKRLMAGFDINSRIMERRDKFVVYIKDGSAIESVLNVIGAHKALLEFENIRILKEMRESVNRQVNCETANINKTVAASIKQLEDIELIRDSIGLDNLDDNLKQICIARLENPDVALSELGNLMKPPLGKSGVNHRFRKLGSIADEIRGVKGKQ